ncbi:MAG: ATP-binding protein [Alphaproteobacteria bacterium]|nr:ATP-binding protein [Alphaproteobacteria bacterium]
MTESVLNSPGVTSLRLSTSTKDAILCAIAFLVLLFFFISIDLVESVFEWTRDYEEWELDEVLASIPPLALVTAWFSYRRWREVGQLNEALRNTLEELERSAAQQRAIEQQLRHAQKMEALGKLSAGLAHELNNVLQPIVTLSQLGAKREDPPAESQEKMRNILDAAEHGCEIVREVLTFAAGGSREAETLVLSRALVETVAVSRGLLAETIELETQFPEDSGLVRLNPVELTQVVTNLVTNAADAMGRKGKLFLGLDSCFVNVAESEAHGLAPGNYFRLTVRDDGPGIAPDVQARIFDPFFSTKSVGEGTGLGLAIVYGIVGNWGGRISVSSAPGCGATFEILIPRIVPETENGS